MELRLYDTLTREKRPFVPLDPNNVRMYVCGPTVYDFAHIGNGRAAIVFDLLFRLLRHLYGESHVTYVRNITDVDDKINARAVRDFPDLPLNEAIRRVTEKTATQYHADVAALGCLLPTVEPRATDFVLPRPDGKADMVTLIKQLITRGHAYEAGGEVLFDTASMPDYGMLSGRKLDEQKAGARVAVEAHKKNPGDFVLWKQSSDDEPGWDSPWGRGRPGWHIECSAMSAAYLGDVFDIHGGGLDLIFPHHENELAQSRCAHGTSLMANYWMHNGFLQVEGEKMSKSDGNFVTINELLGGWRDFNWPGDVIRFAMFSTHYRQPLDFSQHALEQASIALETFSLFRPVDYLNPSQEFMDALLDDLNTPRAIAELHRLYKVARSNIADLADRAQKPNATIRDSDFQAAEQLLAGLRFLGIDLKAYDPEWARKQAKGILSADLKRKVAALLADRAEARAQKDFKESDRIRDQLAEMSIIIKDGKDADGKPVTTWEIAR
jgi:cysteinyl-tRNA synthetase